MNNKLQKLALLGTSADPPTYGHQALLKGLSNIYPKVITWASENPLKTHFVSLEKRQQLLAILVNDLNIPNLEVDNSLSSSWTITTLEKAKKLWPSNELVLIIGSDLIAQIASWVRAKDLLQKARLGIVPRVSWPINESDLTKLRQMGAIIDILPLNIPMTASSEIRKKPQSCHIPQAILPILMKENLYGFSHTTK